MIIIGGDFNIVPEKKAEFLELAKTMVSHTSGNNGCLEFRFSEALDETNKIQLFEIWDSDQSLERHFKSDYFSSYISKVRKCIQGNVNIKRYYISDVQSLYGDN